MRIVAFGGRLLLSTIFIMSGVSKLTSYDAQTGGPMMHVVAPKMDCFLQSLDQAAQFDVPFDLVKAHYGDLIFAAGVLEVAGGLLFILDFSLGAVLLMLFLIGVTPVMHNFWDPVCYKDEQVPEMINFLKNVSIFGGLLAYATKAGKYQKFKVE